MSSLKIKKLKDVTIILPAVNETFSFEETVEIILQECSKEDIKELIAVVCKKLQKNHLLLYIK